MSSERAGFDPEQVVSYWLRESEEALEVADHLVASQDYSYALFFGHLGVEKLLKALYAHRVEQHAPRIHNLLRLAQAAGVELDELQTDALITITAFNIEARYPDLKRSFRAKCTPGFTNRQMTLIKETYQWLRSQLP